jgi:hypothetical protein
VFRVSDGTLVTERHGLKPSETAKRFIGVDEEQGTFYYTIRVMGAREGVLNPHGYTSFQRGGREAFEQWQAEAQMDPKFYEREADHLRPGEAVQLIAINRASGYRRRPDHSASRTVHEHHAGVLCAAEGRAGANQGGN